MKLLLLTACHFMTYKDYKINFKFAFPMGIIILRASNFTSSYVYHHITIYYYIFLEPISCELPWSIINKFWSYTFSLIICCFLTSSKYFIQITCTKNNHFIHDNGVLNRIFKFVPRQWVLRGYILFCLF